jgi:DNA-dependent RNA polymerase auxiliary subunit epsilon
MSKNTRSWRSLQLRFAVKHDVQLPRRFRSSPIDLDAISESDVRKLLTDNRHRVGYGTSLLEQVLQS